MRANLERQFRETLPAFWTQVRAMASIVRNPPWADSVTWMEQNVRLPKSNDGGGGPIKLYGYQKSMARLAMREDIEWLVCQKGILGANAREQIAAIAILAAQARSQVDAVATWTQTALDVANAATEGLGVLEARVNTIETADGAWTRVNDGEHGELTTWADARVAAEADHETRIAALEEGGETGGGTTDPELPEGGTTGQVLAKASGTDGDVHWVDPAAGGEDTRTGAEILVSTGGPTIQTKISNIDSDVVDVGGQIGEHSDALLVIGGRLNDLEDLLPATGVTTTQIEGATTVDYALYQVASKLSSLDTALYQETSGLVALLQEARDEITELKARVTALETA